MLSAFSSYTQIFKINLEKILGSLKSSAKTISNSTTSKTFYKDTDFKYCGDGLYVIDESISDNTHISYFNNSDPLPADSNEDLNKYIKHLPQIIYNIPSAFNCFINLGNSTFLTAKYPYNSHIGECGASFADQSQYLWLLKSYEVSEQSGENDPEPYFIEPKVMEYSDSEILTGCAVIKRESERLGVLCVNVIMNTYAEALINNPPTPHGFYTLISPSGKIEACSEMGLRLLYNLNENENIELGRNISESYSEFKKIYDEGILKQSESENEIIFDISVDGNIYRIFIGNKTYEVFYLVGVIPIMDLTRAAIWESDKDKIVLNYMSNETEISEYFTIKNTGFYVINYVINNNEYYNFDKPSGKIEMGESVKIKVNACVKEDCELPPIIISNVNKEYDICYKTIEILMEKKMVDCDYSDYEVRKGDLDGYYHTIYFDKKLNSSCKGGIEYIPNERIPSNRANGSALEIVFIFLHVLTCVMVIISYIIMSLRLTKLNVVMRTETSFIICYSIGYILEAANTILLLSTEGCFKMIIGYVGSTVMLCGMLCMTTFVITQEIKKHMVFDHEIFFVLKRLIPMMIIEIIAIALTSNGREDSDHLYKFHENLEISIRTCGREDWKFLVANISPVFVSFLVFLDCITLFRAKIDVQSMILTIGIFIMDLYYLLYVIFNTSTLITTSSYVGTASVQLVYSILFCITYLMIFDFHVHKKNSVNPYQKTAAVYTSILSDPITRTCLFYHMCDLHQQESLFFWEDVNRLKKMCANANDEQIKDYCERMVDRYIKNDAYYQINIDASMQHEIENDCKTKPSPFIFDRAYDEITSLIRQNCCSSFVLSKHATTAKQLLKWFSVFDELSVELKEAVQKKIEAIRIENKNYAQSHTTTMNTHNTHNTLKNHLTQHIHHEKVPFSVFAKDEEEVAEAENKISDMLKSATTRGLVNTNSFNSSVHRTNTGSRLITPSGSVRLKKATANADSTSVEKFDSGDEMSHEKRSIQPSSIIPGSLQPNIEKVN